MRLESINVGAIERVVHGDASHDTGICKVPVDGAVRITTLGIPGDAIVSTAHHGGPDQAIYAYSADDYDWWQAEKARDYFPGLFGENLTIRDLPTDMNVGDRLLIGEVVLEATAPRIPCGTFAARMQDAGFGLTFRNAERPGAYFRVLNEGEVTAGDVVTLVENGTRSVSIVELFRYKYARRHDPVDLQRMLEAPLAERMRVDIEKKLATLSPV
jgi:MOSC domain-containing protein YiiM